MDVENEENPVVEEEVVEAVEETEEVIESEELDSDRDYSGETSYRSIDLARAEYIDEENRTVRIALSSEEPVERSFGIEILDHSRESVDMEWAKSAVCQFCLTMTADP